jgi:hypothetical protein
MPFGAEETCELQHRQPPGALDAVSDPVPAHASENGSTSSCSRPSNSVAVLNRRTVPHGLTSASTTDASVHPGRECAVHFGVLSRISTIGQSRHAIERTRPEQDNGVTWGCWRSTNSRLFRQKNHDRTASHVFAAPAVTEGSPDAHS